MVVGTGVFDGMGLPKQAGLCARAAHTNRDLHGPGRDCCARAEAPCCCRCMCVTCWCDPALREGRAAGGPEAESVLQLSVTLTGGSHMGTEPGDSRGSIPIREGRLLARLTTHNRLGLWLDTEWQQWRFGPRWWGVSRTTAGFGGSHCWSPVETDLTLTDLQQSHWQR